jgi:hypothetical protein
MVIDDAYNYYLTLLIFIFYKLINYYFFSKNFYNFIFFLKVSNFILSFPSIR